MPGTPPIGPSWPLLCSWVWSPMPPASCFLWGPWVGWSFSWHPLRGQAAFRGLSVASLTWSCALASAPGTPAPASALQYHGLWFRALLLSCLPPAPLPPLMRIISEMQNNPAAGPGFFHYCPVPAWPFWRGLSPCPFSPCVLVSRSPSDSPPGGGGSYLMALSLSMFALSPPTTTSRPTHHHPLSLSPPSYLITGTPRPSPWSSQRGLTQPQAPSPFLLL